jgi:hypothetical protein
MQYTLTGFTHVTSFRVFAFECVGEGGVRPPYKVKAGLLLIRKCGHPHTLRLES